MQKIYMTGVGDIALEPAWKTVTKPENFRSPLDVLSVINNIRSGADGLVQIPGKKVVSDAIDAAPEGSAQIIVLPADDNREQYLFQVRTWLAAKNDDSLWVNDLNEADVKVLVIVHEMAAKRLGFATLHSAFNSRAPESFRAGFREDSHWTLKPFMQYLLPLAKAFSEGDDFAVMQLLRQSCPLLSKTQIANAEDKSKLLSQIKGKVEKLSLMLNSEESTISDVLKFSKSAGLLVLDERFFAEASDDAESEETQKRQASLAAYYECPAKQLWGYHKYMNDESPYDTHQGIKGAEFERVLVVLDDEEGSSHRSFSYEKLLGIKELTKTDKENQASNKDSSVERTRRLFYVCCSRSLRDLAVVLFTRDTESAVVKVKESNLFEEESIFTASDIGATI